MTTRRPSTEQQPPRAKVWDGSGEVCVTFQADAGADAAISRCARCGCAEWLHKIVPIAGEPCT